VFAALAQTPVRELMKPLVNARHFIIESKGGKHGDSWMWIAVNGHHLGRESMNLRGQVFELDSDGKPGADGMPSMVAVRGTTPSGDAAETFGISAGAARWKSPIDAGTANYSAPAFYMPQGGPMALTAWFVETLLATPDKTLELLPGGRAHAERLTELAVGAGPTKQAITLWSVTGIGTSPIPVWADANNKFFGAALGIAWLPDTYAGEQSRIQEAQAKALAAQAPGLMKSSSRRLRDQ
jgi:hypothetical protein